ncbi:hypothetical protein [Phyllobacterium phragmitis]|uniref:Phosphodiesterase n=1 Tax=Phyllobacterium phragmitis TaxID=2670329 RepID=A0ABQ0H5M7_9HYPH
MSRDEHNTEASFRRSFALGFGTETDIRDHDGEIVISHDPARAGAMPFRRFLEIYRESTTEPLPLALNIKADGLQEQIAGALNEHGIQNYFLFDMSVPDAIQSLRAHLICFTRISDIEPVPSFYEQAAGIWLDGFHSDWFDADDILPHLGAGKSVCIVSPELHGRNPTPSWERLAGSSEILASNKVFLCTDLPERARTEFPCIEK